MGAQPDGLTCPECGAEGPEKVFSTFAGGASRSNSAQPAGSCGSGRFT
jgi:hypothetical protein